MPNESAQHITDAGGPAPGVDSWSALREQLELDSSRAAEAAQRGQRVESFAATKGEDPLELGIWQKGLRQDEGDWKTNVPVVPGNFHIGSPPPTRVVFEWGLGLGRRSSFQLRGHESVHLGNEAPERLSGPLQFVRSLVRSWNLDEGAAVRLLGFEPQDAVAASVLSGHTRLTRDAKDRVANLVQIKSLLDSLFRDIATETEWLDTPKRELNNRTPRSLLQDGTLESLLTLRYFVEHLSRL